MVTCMEVTMEILYIKLSSKQPILKMSLAADQRLLTSSYQRVVGRRRRPFVFLCV